MRSETTGREFTTMPKVILNFDGFDGPNEWAFLSNFWDREPVVISGTAFLTGEHAFQAAKAHTEAEFRWVAEAPGPGTAKSRGRRVDLRRDWEQVKYDVMRAVVANKFDYGTTLGDALVSTGDALLVEGTRWRDEVWGVDLERGDMEGRPGARSPGRNWLGTLLMARRAELRAGHEGVFLPLPDAFVLTSGLAQLP